MQESLSGSSPGAGWNRVRVEAPGCRRCGHPPRALARPCLDWSVRRDHVAGAVGAAITRMMLERGWLARLPRTRAVRLTLRGREALYRTFGVYIPQPDGA